MINCISKQSAYRHQSQSTRRNNFGTWIRNATNKGTIIEMKFP